jgi:hypothetical protein
MITPYAQSHRWRVGTLAHERRDTSCFSQVLVLGFAAGERILIVSVEPPPWATPAERGVRSVLACSMEPCESRAVAA